jgi:hypothetical protein
MTLFCCKGAFGVNVPFWDFNSPAGFSASTKAYEAFRCYLNMGEKRTMNAVASRYRKSISLINRWSSGAG